MDERIRQLEKTARQLRLNIVKMVGPGKAGHFGGSCSLADIITVLYFHKMKHDPHNPKLADRDRLILSKGHAAIVQYAALAMCGYFPVDELPGLKRLGSILQGHPDMEKIPGIEGNTGSLGQGLSLSAGIAAGLRIDKIDSRVYCAVGDGEQAEGQIWEAAMAASFYKLNNLTAILDFNRIQATGPVIERFNTNPVREKWEAFGWKVDEIDGHDIRQIIDALERADAPSEQPVMIIAHTIKGKGISFAENTAAFHNGIMTEEQYETACRSLED